MLVYGDTHETVSPRLVLEQLDAALADLRESPQGLTRHAALVGIFIRLSGVTQGVADAEAAARGHDDLSDMQERLHAALLIVAAAIDVSWTSGFARQLDLSLPPVYDLDLPAAVTVKRCEGFAFYALYPEAYLAAARDLPAESIIIGLRSIGTGLAALVGAASGAASVLTVRPRGHPFARSIVAGPDLTAFVAAHAHRFFVIVDEGPGLSGSSFAGTADWLRSLDVSEERIIFMPSHDGAPGDQASPSHRAQWVRIDKRVRSFDQLFTGPGAKVPLHNWFADITGDLVEPPVDLSGGRWADRRPDLPTSPSREARKFLLRSSKGEFLIKFVGLDQAAGEKFERAAALHAGGFCLKPLALRYGYLIEPFVRGAPARGVPMQRLIEYLSFRREQFPARQAGTSLADLLAMATYNLAQVDTKASDELAARWSEDHVRALQPFVEPVHVDARLHHWEWLETEHGVVKTDAIDHSQAHDLVGCQDILWDLAGAIVEFPDLAPALNDHADMFAATDARRDLFALMKIAYPAFQMGWWSLSGTPAGLVQSELYRCAMLAELAGAG